ncbi:XRE family transcriptional regulator [Acetobacteraceae bacterium KSS8]|uniref:XRE family transcriptional regulator n=1 Tax=Endosaccharibacter trunci TaxID=2812733 RepID=A0ABT1WAY0_9PROT|nr:XRE family transcriptional regulator [Acetobacteraceae bacterium KSS8]
MDDTPDITYVRRLMAAGGMNQTALARQAGVDPSQLSKLLNGKNKSGRLAPETMDRLRAYAASVGYDEKTGTATVSVGQAPKSVHPRNKAALARLWDRLDEPEQDLTFDIVEAAVANSLRRRFGSK